MPPKRKGTNVHSYERSVRSGASRGNTWATLKEAETGKDSSLVVARSAAMDNIRRRTISMLRNSESNKPPEHKSRSIKWLIERFCAGELCIYGNSQRGMVCSVGWARQFLSMILNSSTSVPAITLRKVIELRDVNGRSVNKEIFYVTDGAQRLTAILWFYLGLIEVDVIDKPAQRRSQRNIFRNRKEGGIEVDPLTGDAEQDYTRQFFDKAISLMYSDQPRFPLIFSPCDADGVLIGEDQEVDDDHPEWCLNTRAAPYRDDAAEPVKDFFDKYLIALGIGTAAYERQTAASKFASDEVRLRFLSREIGVDETCWSQQAGSHVNLWQSLQQYFFGVNELVCLVGDHASEWLKTLVADVVEITGPRGVGYDMQKAYGAIVRAFVIVHGAPRVPVQDDAPLWAFVIDYLGENFIDAEPSDLMKRRFAAAARNMPVPPRPKARLNPDEVTLMIALTYYAISDDSLPSDVREKTYPASIISPEDKARLAGHLVVMKNKGVKKKVVALRKNFDSSVDSSQRHELASRLNTSQAVVEKRNLARYVRNAVHFIPFDAEQYAEPEEDEEAEEEQPATPPSAPETLPGTPPPAPKKQKTLGEAARPAEEHQENAGEHNASDGGRERSSDDESSGDENSSGDDESSGDEEEESSAAVLALADAAS